MDKASASDPPNRWSVRSRPAKREIFSSREMPGEIVDVLVVHEAVYRERRQALRRLVDGWFTGLDYLASNRTQAADLMARRQRTSPQEVLASFDGLRLPSREENQRLLDSEHGTLNAVAGRLVPMLLDKELLTRQIDTRGIFSTAVIGRR